MALRRPAFLVAMAVAASVVGRGWWRRRRLLAPVLRELRSPVLWLPLRVTGDRTLKVVRSIQPRIPLPTAPPGVTVETCHADGPDGGRIRMLVHQAADRDRPSGALLWIHGGGLIIGVPEQSAEFCNRLASELGVVVANVEYRLAPEDPFPAGLDDCVAALGWLHDHAGDLGIDPSRIAVGGESAGGGLAAAVCQRALDDDGPPVAFQALIYPMLDDRTVLRADGGGRGQFLWTARDNRYGWTAYLGHEPRAEAAEPYAAPARRPDLAGLPPAWIGIGDLDLFYEENVEYAGRLDAAGVACERHVVPGMYHAADKIVPRSPAVVAFYEGLTAALRLVVGSPIASEDRQ